MFAPPRKSPGAGNWYSAVRNLEVSPFAMTGFTTSLLQSERHAEGEHGARHAPVFTSSAFAYRDMRELVDVFQGERRGYVYSRQLNPTVTALENRISAMEGGVGTICFASGMAAVSSAILALLRRGDHVLASRFLFGNTYSLFNTLSNLGIDVTYADSTSMAELEDGIRTNTRLVFVETIANPRTQISDLEGIGRLCERLNLVYCVDNTMTSPYLYRPVEAGASLVINSLTKYIAGHGDAIGGSLTDTGRFDWKRFANINDDVREMDPPSWCLAQVRKRGLRDFGGALDAAAAHRIAVGLETLALRQERQCANAMALAQMLDQCEGAKAVHYPGLEHHPRHEWAMRWFRHPGALLSFEVASHLGDPTAVMNRLRIAVRSTNLGDNRTLVIPVAKTIYHEFSAQQRSAMGIADSLVRVSVGIEDLQDLLTDFERALAIKN